MFTIRLARPDEYEAVGSLTLAAYADDGHIGDDHAYAEELRDAAARADGAELWVAADDEHLLGSVTYCPPGSPFRELGHDDDQGEFRMLAVAAAARRRGVGRALVRHCLDRSASLGHREVVLCSLPTMTGAHAIYDQLGFRRDPTLDWQPVPDVQLLGFRKDLSRAGRESARSSRSRG